VQDISSEITERFYFSYSSSYKYMSLSIYIAMFGTVIQEVLGLSYYSHSCVISL
jgi:hypothetical protein